MVDRHAADARIRAHYERVWAAGDAWNFETSAYEQDRLAFLASLIADRRSARAVEIGCGSGCFTQRLRRLADHVVAIDVAAAAIERASARAAADHETAGTVEFLAANAMEHDFQAGGPWDLIVLAETIYSLGWLYSTFDLGMFALHLRDALAANGRLLLANTYGAERDWLMRPFLIDTYHDLFRNVGLRSIREASFEGEKDGEVFHVRATVFETPTPPTLYSDVGASHA
jgi:SAM-dependent methyltransferase